MQHSFVTAIIGIGILAVAPVYAASAVFSDVFKGDLHEKAVEWIVQQGLVSGYPDGSFRPDRKVNRAEAVKMIVNSMQVDTAGCKSTSFSDVPDSAWFAPYVCTAVKNEWVIPAGDNPRFRPSDTINAGELSAMLARVYDYDTPASDPWYASSITALSSRHIIPSDIEAPGQRISRAQLAEMLWRLQQKPEHVSSADPERMLSVACDWQEPEDIPHVDDEELVRTWMNWVNGLRAERGLQPYKVDRQLSSTAQEWSDHARASGAITHKRPGQTAYYDYNRMKSWFASQDLSFSNVNSTTFTENIGWGVYRCKKEECTADLIDALRTTFDMYVAEEHKPSRAHWNSMVNPDFRLAGIGVSVDETSGKYYFTAHYATAIDSDPNPICP